MRPLFGPVGNELLADRSRRVATLLGGASAAAISGLDSMGGGGAFSMTGRGAGVPDDIGSLTVGFGSEVTSAPPLGSSLTEDAVGVGAFGAVGAIGGAG